jgi:hypothetical protein
MPSSPVRRPIEAGLEPEHEQDVDVTWRFVVARA